VLKLRVLSGAAFIVVALTCIWLGGVAHIAMITFFALLCVRELCRLFALKGYAPATLIITASVLLMNLMAGFMGPTYMAPVFTFSAIAILVWLLARRRPRAGIADIATSWFALIYVGFLPCHLILVRNLPDPYGLQFTILLNTCIWATDIFAYFGGRLFGRTKLLEAVSPKKTIEGSVTGFVFAGALGGLWAWLFSIPLIHGFALGVIVSVVAQIGDLTESLLKRDAGTKDSGTAIPGHGGILDRLDSYLLTGAAVYYYLRWVYHPWLP
jgi:phosphatidate cytidylyltransferase